MIERIMADEAIEKQNARQEGEDFHLVTDREGENNEDFSQDPVHKPLMADEETKKRNGNAPILDNSRKSENYKSAIAKIRNESATKPDIDDSGSRLDDTPPTILPEFTTEAKTKIK